ncbi:DgyrCDS2475 [Dimorphilus gyrociliatus]|uniref:mRNA m(6)A methyltransferase n=1 Tax=Dimorphilus gyrociliatus TaxID=2664684 RepID=A0A7I8VD60_9ANNE|nr:DgyrCDS2475 [Dimorphilus gyrociliatus]
MSDTWNALQAAKNKNKNIKELMRNRKWVQNNIVDTKEPVAKPNLLNQQPTKSQEISPENLQSFEKKLFTILTDVNLDFPAPLRSIEKSMNENGEKIALNVIKELLFKFSAQKFIKIKEGENEDITVESVDFVKITAFYHGTVPKRKREEDEFESEKKAAKVSKMDSAKDLESLLSSRTTKERENMKPIEEIRKLLEAPTAKELSMQEKFQSKGGHLKEFCAHGTREECKQISGSKTACGKLHFKKLIHKHTDPSLGDCSFLNTCFHMDTCKYVHYTIEYSDEPKSKSSCSAISKFDKQNTTRLFAPQWVQCDIRALDMKVLGKFAVIMADPPWDIHMELPYGTMSDEEMRTLDVPTLQDDGYIFLWVTGRAMELGRECLKVWGYERCDELIWVKTNQLQRIIRTGRTGHWLNHGKEHCLVGVKGFPTNFNKGLDCDVIVAEVRETSHKPDEIYGIIERLSPGARKIELFGRMHNVQPNWITLGNQLDGVKLLEPDCVKRFKQRYPDENAMKPPTGPEIVD